MADRRATVADPAAPAACACAGVAVRALATGAGVAVRLPAACATAYGIADGGFGAIVRRVGSDRPAGPAPARPAGAIGAGGG